MDLMGALLLLCDESEHRWSEHCWTGRAGPAPSHPNDRRQPDRSRICEASDRSRRTRISPPDEAYPPRLRRQARQELR